MSAAQPGPADTAAAVPRWDWGPAGPSAPAPEDAAGDQAPPAKLPEPRQPVSFAAHISPMFRDRDRQSMSFAFDLGSCGDVRAHAQQILARLADGSMPCDGAWPAEQVDVFRRWARDGMLP